MLTSSINMSTAGEENVGMGDLGTRPGKYFVLTVSVPPSTEVLAESGL